MPSRWRVLLSGPVGVGVPLEAPHAVVSRWLDTDGAHRAPVKPYAIGPPSVEGDRTVLEIRLLDDRLSERLVGSAPAGAPVRLGRHRFRVAARPSPVDAVAWAELSWRCSGPCAGPVEQAWRVVFESPATFRSGNRSSPFPAPGAVLRGLLSRWRLLDPDSVPTPQGPEPRSVWVSDLEGRTVTVRRAGRILPGFVGEVRYVCDPPEGIPDGPGTPSGGAGPEDPGNPGDREVVGSLLRFAEYAGVGSHTPFGFGTIRVDRVWNSSARTRSGPSPGSRRP